MDAALLTNPSFWDDPLPCSPGGEIPDIPELQNHVLFRTSGSSGAPKWIALSKSALLLSAACVNRHLGVDETSRWGLALPLHHVGGFGVLARAFEAGCGRAEFPGRWDAVAFQQWAGKFFITHSSLVPAQVHDLVSAQVRAPASIRAIVVGGGHLDSVTGQAARDLGWLVLASYGMTEAGSQIATQSLQSLNAPYHSGNIPLLPIWQARITEDEILEIAGPALFSGTLDHRGNYTPRCDDWHRTSDRVTLENGILTPLGRADFLVKILGELVDPEAIERELIVCSEGKLKPGSFAVTAVPDDRAEHRLVPVFESSIDPEIVQLAHVAYNAQTPGFRRLQAPVFTQLIPRGALGKILRAELRKLPLR